MRKICFVTGSRAESGILHWLMKAVLDHQDLEFQLIVTGMHLSPEFGLTYQEVEKSFVIDKKVEILLSSDTAVGVSKSMGLALISFAEAFADLEPDIVVVLGDRFEVFSAAAAALISSTPLAHIHGGEVTEGAFDEALRHSITKMSHIHFTSCEPYRQRVIQLGEQPDSVFNFGAPGLDYIHRVKLLSKAELEKSLDFSLGDRNLLVTFHPVTLESDSGRAHLGELLTALKTLKGTKIIFTKSNADLGGRLLNEMIDGFVEKNREDSAVYTSLGQLRYLSLLQYVDAMVGNSSSGYIEAPSFQIGTLNIGDRQSGRVKSLSVIDSEPQSDKILAGINKLYSIEFQKLLLEVENPYGGGGVAEKIVDKLHKYPLSSIVKKKFFDLPSTLNL